MRSPEGAGAISVTPESSHGKGDQEVGMDADLLPVVVTVETNFRIELAGKFRWRWDTRTLVKAPAREGVGAS
jgi:hypothetical protein